jgi:hypothetical protein
MVMAELPTPRKTHVLLRGEYDKPRDEVTAGTPAALPPMPEDFPRNRLGLARWLVMPDHPLTARVAVNRFWQQLFGTGIVKTTEDFGSQGDWPSHPELLDWLANVLIDHGWQLKRLHRLIMTSSVYMQSTASDESRASIDRENQLLWRWTPRRLEAEAIRDCMLAVSGKLDRTMFGPGTLDQHMTRRSVYFFIKRSQLIPMMMLFDWPEHLVSIGQRSSTTIAPQALMFLNSEQGRQYARAFAARLSQSSAEVATEEAYRLALARSPTAEEAALSLAFLRQQQTLYQQQKVAEPLHAALIDLCQTLMSTSEFVYVE